MRQTWLDWNRRFARFSLLKCAIFVAVSAILSEDHCLGRELEPCEPKPRAGKWEVHESRNFRFYHLGKSTTIPALARVCEEKRADVLSEWLKLDPKVGWNPKCDVFLYDRSVDYAAATGYPAESKGHANLEVGDGRVWRRRLDLRMDQPNFSRTVLAHEVTHVALADRFHSQQIPRWSDEGIAVLGEHANRRHQLATMLAEEESLFSLHELVHARSYPYRRTELFYAQSASLVEFLVERMGKAAFIDFLQKAQNHGYDAAVEHALGMKSLVELEQDWTQWRILATRYVGETESAAE